jgi:formylmethanofuran dehydrogenase subunit E
MRKKKEKAKRSCSQCGENMEHSAEVVSNGYVTMLVPVCTNPACPSYALLQIAKEQMP